MSGFRDMMADDLNIFFDTEEFAELVTVRCSGSEFRNVRCVIGSTKERDRKEHRKSFADDNSEAFFVRRVKLCMPLCDMQGFIPKNGMGIGLTRETDEAMQRYIVRNASEVAGMLNLEVEVIDI